MTNKSTSILVIRPSCDICLKDHSAFYSGKTTWGPWANMCEKCFKKYGVGEGPGKGYRIQLTKSI